MQKYRNVQDGVKYQFLLFTRLKVLCMIYLLMATLYCGFSVFLAIKGLFSYQVLFTMSRFSYYYVMIITGIAFILFSKVEDSLLEEVSISISAGKRNYGIYSYLFINLLALFVQAGLWVALIIAHICNDVESNVLLVILKNFIYNITIPVFISISFAYLITTIRNKIISYGSLVAFLAMISPFAENLIFSDRPSVPVDKVWKLLRWPFQLLYQNGQWGADYQYGLQTEIPRLELFLSWLIFLGMCIGFQRLRFRYKKTTRRVFLSMGVIFTGIILVDSTIPSSMYRINHQWDGYYKDFNCYAGEKNGIETMEEPEFQIKSYDMEIKLQKMLTVNASLLIESTQEQKTFSFTLYEGYEVSSLKTDSAITSTFDRQGDNLIITFSQPVKTFNMELTYSGYHNVFYANSEASLLPGYFPWYLMAGERQIFVEYAGGEYGYNPYNRVSQAEFHLKIDTNQNIVTNLSKLSSGEYSGDSDGITLLTGNVKPLDNQNVISYLPLELDRSKEDFIINCSQRYERALQQLKDTLGLDTSGLEGKRIMCVSKDIGRNFSNQSISVYKDYILTGEGDFNYNDLVKYICNQSRADAELIRIGVESCNGKNAEEIVSDMEQSMQQEVNIYASHSGKTDTEMKKLQRYYEIGTNIQKAVSCVGAEEFVKTFYNYISGSLRYDTEEQFWASFSTASETE